VTPTEADGPDADGCAPSDQDLQAMLDEQRRDDASAQRRRARSLDQQAAGSSTLAGVLRDLGEHGAGVTVEVTGCGPLRGRITGLGADFVVITADDTAVTVPLQAVELVRPDPGQRRAAGDREPGEGRTLAAVLEDLAADAATVQVRTRSGDRVSGELVAAGIDVVAVSRPGAGPVYIPCTAVAQVIVTANAGR
jgi:DNA-binding transcriptional LysR family regulator